MKNIIITESTYKRLFLTENASYDSVKGAMRLYKANNAGASDKDAKDWVDSLIKKFDLVGIKQKFTAGVARMYLNGEIPENEVPTMQTLLNFLADNAEYTNKYNKNLDRINSTNLKNVTRLPFNDFKSELSKKIQALKNESEKLANGVKTSGVSEYEINKIDSFEEANEYAGHVGWCLTKQEGYYDAYVSEGGRRLYICTKPGFEDLTDPDEKGYRLSMIGVIVDTDNTVYSWVDRMNDDEHRYTDDPSNKAELIKILKVKFNDVFERHYTQEEVNNVIMNGMGEITKLSDSLSYGKYKGEYYLIKDGKLLTDKNGNHILLGSKHTPDENGYYLVELGNKLTFIDSNGENAWHDKCFDWISPQDGNRNYIVGSSGKGWELVDAQGKNICDNNIFYTIYDPDSNYNYTVKFDNKQLALIAPNGESIFGNMRFDYIRQYDSGNYKVVLNGDIFYINYQTLDVADEHGNVIGNLKTPNFHFDQESETANAVHESIRLNRLIKSITRKVIREQLMK